jgi:hypothetical protein
MLVLGWAVYGRRIPGGSSADGLAQRHRVAAVNVADKRACCAHLRYTRLLHIAALPLLHCTHRASSDVHRTSFASVFSIAAA